MLNHESEGTGIRSNKLYTLVRDEFSGGAATVEPTQYFRELTPSDAIVELKAHVEHLFGKLRRYTDENQDNPEHLEEAHHLLYELEVAQKFLVHVRQGFAKKGYSLK